MTPLLPSSGRRLAWSLSVLLLTAAITAAHAQKHLSRGLWVGQVTLNEVNEVSVPIDENGQERPPNPNVTTPTADAAHLRLILHVDGAGQVRLLKEVALLNRAKSPSDPTPASSLDVALVTDESLYPNFPAQAARRIASASLDFGDVKAVDGVQALVDQAGRIATEAALNGNGAVANFSSPDANDALFVGKISESVLNGIGPAPGQVTPGYEGLHSIVANADVNDAYFAFINEDFPNPVQATDFLHVVETAIAVASAEASGASGGAAARTTAALTALNGNPIINEGLGVAGVLAARSFYGDDRGTNAIESVKLAAAEVAGAAAAAGDTEDLVEAAARKAAYAAASHAADLDLAYNGFLNSRILNVALASATTNASQAAIAGQDIARAIQEAPGVGDAAVRAETIKAASTLSPDIDDNRANDALDRLLAAAETAAAAEAAKNADADPNNDVTELQTRVAVQEAITAERDQIAPDPVPLSAPSISYTAYVKSSSFADAAQAAAQAAGEAAQFQIASRSVTDAATLESQIRLAVFDRLTSAFNQASTVPTHEVLMSGELVAGQTVTGTVFLPANHPTNPFRHRRHPDHTRGFDITRIIELELADPNTGAAAGPSLAGYGVQQLVGIYREEIVGLHKPLGQPNARLGLKVRGIFELNRISLIDNLNAQ